MAMVISKANHPRNLIAMGRMTRHTKDFFQRLKSAKEIINLINSLTPNLPSGGNKKLSLRRFFYVGKVHFFSFRQHNHNP
jgi:hypothetical protein